MIKYLDFVKDATVRRKEYDRAFLRVLDSGWYILGSEVESFEKALAKYLGVKYCVGVGNGLEALQIALMTLEVGKGDEVITTPISALATTLSIMAVGATPIFIDINERGQIDAAKIERAITKRTKAVIPVDLYGQPADLIEIKRVCKKHKLYLIEDAAQAHGATLNRKRLGTYGDIGCFSFYPTKNLGTFGDGGALVTDNKKYAETFRVLRDYGQSSKYVHSLYGLNSRLDELHAALLRVKLGHLEKDNSARRKIAVRYITNLKDVKGLDIVLPKRINDSNFHLFVITADKRDELKNFLNENGVQTAIHYPATLPDQPLFGGKYRRLKIPAARKFVKSVLSLPCYPFLKLSDVDYVCQKVKEYFQQ